MVISVILHYEDDTSRSWNSADDNESVQFVAKLADLEFGYQDESSGIDSSLQPHRARGDERQDSMPPAIPDTVCFSASTSGSVLLSQSDVLTTATV